MPDDSVTQPVPRFRKSRIAWSVVWAIVCGLVLALWVRSYWQWDWVSVPITSAMFLSVNSGSGRIYASTPSASTLQARPGGPTAAFVSEWRWWSRVPSQAYFQRVSLFGLVWDSNSFRIRFPHWFLALSLATVAALPWFAWRFSIRNLLIGVTLMAVLLGMAISMSYEPAASPRRGQRSSPDVPRE